MSLLFLLSLSLLALVRPRRGVRRLRKRAAAGGTTRRQLTLARRRAAEEAAAGPTAGRGEASESIVMAAECAKE